MARGRNYNRRRRGSSGFLYKLLSMIVICAAIMQLVFAYICYYDLFRSCDPENAGIYLVLSIVFSFLQPVFLFACRHKQLGLTPQHRQTKSWQ